MKTERYKGEALFADDFFGLYWIINLAYVYHDKAGGILWIAWIVGKPTGAEHLEHALSCSNHMQEGPTLTKVVKLKTGKKILLRHRLVFFLNIYLFGTSS